MMDPTEIAATMPAVLFKPVILKTKVVNKSAAMVMPDMGLLELPTRPTILDETVPKKNPRIAMRIAPTRDTGTWGISHIKMTTMAIPAMTMRISTSREVLLTPLSSPVPLMPLTASTKVETITGADFTRLMIPPATSIPAPIYRI